MKILILAPFVPIGTIHGMTEGLEACGVEWEGISTKPGQSSPSVRAPGFADHVIRKYEHGEFDTVFIGKGVSIALDQFRKITQNCDTTYWTADSVSGNGVGPPGRPQEVGVRGLLCRRIILTGTEGSRWYRQNGYKGRMAQIYQGCRHRIWKPGHYPRSNQDRLVFLGSAHYKGDGGRRPKFKAIREAGYPMYYSRRLFHEKAAEAYWNSAICINMSCGDITSNRVMRILTSGGFCLTERNADIDHSFTDGQELAMYETGNIPHMLEQIKFYMKNPKLRDEIAMRGHAWTRDKGWDEQMDKMVRFIDGEDIPADGAAQAYIEAPSEEG